MMTRALLVRSDLIASEAGEGQLVEFARLPAIGELIHFGGDEPMLRVVAVMHTPNDQQHHAEIFVEVDKLISSIRIGGQG